jgi:hypothetical protein
MKIKTSSLAMEKSKTTAAKDRLSLPKDMFDKRLQLLAEGSMFQGWESPGEQVKDKLSLGMQAA